MTGTNVSSAENRQAAWVYPLVIIGLFVLTLAVFAIVWPFNGSLWDDWSYPYFGQRGTWDAFNANRDYVFGEAVLAHWLLPGRAQGIYVLHVLSLFGASFGVFHLLNRLNPGYGWFAFLGAATYLGYIPANFDQVRPLYVGVYSWTIVLLMLAAASFVEYFYRRGRAAGGFLLVGSLLGYVACRAYESTIPLLWAVPLLAVLAEKKLSRRVMVGAGVWWSMVGVGTLQFLVPYLSDNPASQYQNTVPVTVNPRLWLSSTRVFYQNGFLSGRLLPMDYSYLLPALAVACVVLTTLVLLWHQSPHESRLPPAGRLGVIVMIGLAWTGLGGSVYIVSSSHTHDRSYFFAAPGQALVVSGGLALVALGFQRLFRVPSRLVLAGLATAFFMTAAHWYYQAENAHYQSNWIFSFSVKNYFLRDVVSLVPGLAEETAIIYYCDDPIWSYQYWRSADLFAGSYLYTDSRSMMFIAGEIPAGSYHSAYFDQEGVSLTSSGAFFTPPKPHYRYDELVVLACQEDGGLRILDRFPPELAPEGANLDNYNPYVRVVQGFIPPERARILAR